eukprot:COSAG01_NODE_1689_length_9488_cov_5.759825_2_plen_80_part_00
MHVLLGHCLAVRGSRSQVWPTRPLGRRGPYSCSTIVATRVSFTFTLTLMTREISTHGVAKVKFLSITQNGKMGGACAHG